MQPPAPLVPPADQLVCLELFERLFHDSPPLRRHSLEELQRRGLAQRLALCDRCQYPTPHDRLATGSGRRLCRDCAVS